MDDWQRSRLYACDDPSCPKGNFAEDVASIDREVKVTISLSSFRQGMKKDCTSKSIMAEDPPKG